MSLVAGSAGGGTPQRDDDASAALIDRLDLENEHYLHVTMDLRNLLEDAVNREVALERENHALRQRIGQLEGGLDAVLQTPLMRLIRPVRQLWSWLKEGVRRG